LSLKNGVAFEKRSGTVEEKEERKEEEHPTRQKHNDLLSG
jgi:hypothetical protein